MESLDSVNKILAQIKLTRGSLFPASMGPREVNMAPYFCRAKSDDSAAVEPGSMCLRELNPQQAASSEAVASAEKHQKAHLQAWPLPCSASTHQSKDILVPSLSLQESPSKSGAKPVSVGYNACGVSSSNCAKPVVNSTDAYACLANTVSFFPKEMPSSADQTFRLAKMIHSDAKPSIRERRSAVEAAETDSSEETHNSEASYRSSFQVSDKQGQRAKSLVSKSVQLTSQPSFNMQAPHAYQYPQEIDNFAVVHPPLYEHVSPQYFSGAPVCFHNSYQQYHQSQPQMMMPAPPLYFYSHPYPYHMYNLNMLHHEHYASGYSETSHSVQTKRQTKRVKTKRRGGGRRQKPKMKTKKVAAKAAVNSSSSSSSCASGSNFSEHIVETTNNPKASNSPFHISIENINDGKETRTTIMMKNIPKDFTQESLLHLLIDSGFNRRFDFVYMPIDLAACENIGYAFVNFLSSADVMNFHMQYHNFKWDCWGKTCQVTFARLQGKKALTNQFKRRSSQAHSPIPTKFLPLYLKDGQAEDLSI